MLQVLLEEGGGKGDRGVEKVGKVGWEGDGRPARGGRASR